MLESQGIKLTRTTSDSFIDKQWLVAESIAQQNDGVWIDRETIPSQYQYEVIPAKDNMNLITRWLGQEKQPVIAWKPSNPYSFITGAIEVSEWKFILKTNHNARFAIIWGVFGWFAYSVISQMIRDRKKKHETPA